MNRSATLAAASRDFKNTVGSMRIAVKDFAASPSVSQVVAFNQAQKLSLQSLDTIEIIRSVQGTATTLLLCARK